MAQLYFYYGAMNSSKSASLLMASHNYESQGKKTILMTPSVDDRNGVGVISSRAGMEKEAIVINEDDRILTIVNNEIKKDFPSSLTEKIHCILVDEAQFLKKEHILELGELVDILDIPVMCYGLKNDFQNNLFEGTKALLLYADKIVEIKTICAKEKCGKKAIMNLRLSNGKPVYEGRQVQIGDEQYLPVCRKHYFGY